MAISLSARTQTGQTTISATAANGPKAYIKPYVQLHADDRRKPGRASGALVWAKRFTTKLIGVFMLLLIAFNLALAFGAVQVMYSLAR